jgi:hypothetical protein
VARAAPPEGPRAGNNNPAVSRARGRSPRPLTQILGLLVVVLAAVVVGALPVLAPPGNGEIAIERAVDHVAFIAREPHPMGSPQITRVREYLVARLAEMGITVATQVSSAPDYFGTPGETVEIVNVMARIDGSDADAAGAVLLTAHYDSTPATPGANDDAAAVAALLEAMRVLAADPPPNDVIVLLTDGEEPAPRFGASAFRTHPWFADVAIVTNFEGIGSAGPAMVVELAGPSHDLADRIASATSHPAVFSFLTRTAELIGGAASDFDVFLDAGIPGYNVAFLRGSSIYHTDRDDLPALNRAGMGHQASIALGVARELGSLDLDEADDTVGSVFFTIPGWVVVSYGAGVARATALSVAAVSGVVLALRIRRRDRSIASVVGGAGLSFAGALVAASFAGIAWTAIVSLRSEMGVLESYVWLLAMIAVLAGGWYLVCRASGRFSMDLGGGIVLVWAALALLTGFLLPSMSYLFTWPALLGAVALALPPRLWASRGRLASLAVLTVPIAIVLVPPIDTFFQIAGPRPGNPDSELPAAIVVPLLLAILAIGLVQAASAPGRAATTAPAWAGGREPTPAVQPASRSPSGVASSSHTDATDTDRRHPTYPAGRPPWDVINGLRVGGLAGGVVGVLLTAVAGWNSFWPVLPAIVIGGAVGYGSELRKRHRESD